MREDIELTADCVLVELVSRYDAEHILYSVVMDKNIPEEERVGIALQRAMDDEVDLKEVDLSGADLRHFKFKHYNLTKAKFEGANLLGASFRKVDLFGASFIRATMEAAAFVGGNLHGANFKEANLHSATFTKCHAVYADFRKANLGYVTFTAMPLCASTFMGADCDNMTAVDVNLERADFSGADLTGVQLLRVKFTDARLEGATELSEVECVKVELDGGELCDGVRCISQVEFINHKGVTRHITAYHTNEGLRFRALSFFGDRDAMIKWLATLHRDQGYAIAFLKALTQLDKSYETLYLDRINLHLATAEGDRLCPTIK